MKTQAQALFMALLFAAAALPAQAATTEQMRLGYRPNVFDNTNVDRSELEGWVDHIDVRDGIIGLTHSQGFHTRVPVKPETIGQYKMNDHLRVKMRWDGRVAETVEKLG